MPNAGKYTSPMDTMGPMVVCSHVFVAKDGLSDFFSEEFVNSAGNHHVKIRTLKSPLSSFATFVSCKTHTVPWPRK